ncbi:Protease inhibitor Inh [Faunimonas pinastri]|uniref:Protease inhibitor Inh n=1 Tax=Faunimonas pinastri TaxID=1855383 RepID=A0A1H9JCT3_9HYPH|nr:AprI/Inh family metalloprotease inhibitor [Faunimonas pinastri]SEQ84529.1 Protease inhibitor Inh [Faunimonas pinastri]
MRLRTDMMIFVAAASLGLAGCQSASPAYQPAPPPPMAAPPLAAVPAQPVSRNTLPPPEASMQAPDAPMAGGPADQTMQPGTQVASLPPAQSAASGSGGGASVGRTDLLGGWKLSSAGDSCQLFMSLTTWSGGYRATTRGCNGPALKGVSAWSLDGKQVRLIDDQGATVARLYASSKTQFSGETQAGAPVSFAR